MAASSRPSGRTWEARAVWARRRRSAAVAARPAVGVARSARALRVVARHRVTLGARGVLMRASVGAVVAIRRVVNELRPGGEIVVAHVASVRGYLLCGVV